VFGLSRRTSAKLSCDIDRRASAETDPAAAQENSRVRWPYPLQDDILVALHTDYKKHQVIFDRF
jgi:hypothetical protein